MLLRALGLRGVWGLRPQLGVPPLHPVLSLVAIAVSPSPLSQDDSKLSEGEYNSSKAPIHLPGKDLGTKGKSHNAVT